MESGDRSLEEQLVPHLVGEAELVEPLRSSLEHVDRFAGALEPRHPRVQFTMALREQRIEDRILRGEVLVQRRGVQSHTRSELTHRDRGKPVLASELTRGGEHFVDRRLPASSPRPTILQHSLRTQTLFGIDVKEICSDNFLRSSATQRRSLQLVTAWDLRSSRSMYSSAD